MFSFQPYINAEQLLSWDRELKLGLHQAKAKKGEVFLKGGQRCDHLYFILSGFVRVYYLNLEGQEITHWFCGPSSVITSPFSFRKKGANILYFEALEDSELLLISAEQIEKLIQHKPDTGSALRHINAEFAMILSRRIMSIHTQTAEERYLQLMAEHPELFQKAKLAHIASFLGITQQSLSRIRKHI